MAYIGSRALPKAENGEVYPELFMAVPLGSGAPSAVRNGVAYPDAVTATSFAVLLLAVSVGVCSSGYILLLCYPELLAGVNLIAAGVMMADDPTAFGKAITFPGPGALPAFPRRNLPVYVLGLVTISSAITATVGAAHPALCLGLFALFLVGIALITVGVLGE